MCDHLQPEPCGIGPVLCTGEYACRQFAYQDVVYLLYAACLAALPFKQRLAPPYPTGC